MARAGYAVAHHTDGPRVRLGLAWFAVTLVATAFGPLPLALVMAVAAALAADQLVGFHDAGGARSVGSRPAERAQRLLQEPVRVLAVLGAGALPLAAAIGGDTLASAAMALTVLCIAGSLGRRSDPPLLAQALPLIAAVPIGLAAASPVLLTRVGTAAGLALLMLVAAYDAGDFIVGTGAGTPWEGPVAGVAAVGVIGFALTVVALPPLEEEGSAMLALLVATLAPIGPPLASVLVGNGTTPARFVRRLDSLLLAGPVAAYALAALLPSLAASP